MILPKVPAFQGDLKEGTSAYQSQPTPASMLYVCPKCQRAVWCVPGSQIFSVPVCGETEACRKTKKGGGNIRMIKATARQIELAREHDKLLRKRYGK